MNAIYKGLGQSTLRSYPVASATVIAKGDLVALVSSLLVPAGSFTWTTDLATTQANFGSVFVGVAYTESANGETDNVQVDVSGESAWEYDCASATFLPGALVAPAKQSGNLLESQKLVAAVAAASIGRVHTGVTSATRVRATFASARHTASSNTDALVS